VLNLIQHFIQDVEEEDDKGKKTGQRIIIFPRFHQLEAVRDLVNHARGHGAGDAY
jgi:type I restriction enzyme R subunit